ncbi:MAG: hypothetical protein A3J62_00735 [Candidatus Buchananbacteria bacterium RIFCSPHIGHO2_02_FULL_38_8]|uniref:phosphoribosylglycinamide formyltransferase 1 n=1 Tax=Candidatus Buchananbacteria bacterium RIFCSPHIGHO2_02_FULL_38_8 TaxID=1797538 RepID=A0A1G1Y6T1_9BACT|nr:MAG: hypothetical protein A3J62_00735 [Candidatus Buchananbacteria bacterium RIFCSPHIGHO2_02_FULL_38_8]
MNQLDVSKPRLLVFASGDATGGGSGFEHLVCNQQAGVLVAEIVGVVSNHEKGGIAQKAQRLKIPFFHLVAPYTAEKYQGLISQTGADFVALSGWLKLVVGLDPTRTFNIHPGPLPEFGGSGLYGHHVHEEVLTAFRRGEIRHSAVSMHFVTPEYDRGPVFFFFPVAIQEDDTPEILGARVNRYEHGWQSWVTNLVVNGLISWDGKGPVNIPFWYRSMVFCPLKVKIEREG